MFYKVRDTIRQNLLWFFPKVITHKLQYRSELGKKLNLNKPLDFNEKLQYLIVYKYGKHEGALADKYLVKDYVEGLKINDLHIPKTLAVYKNSDHINLDELPDRFVLKCNHSSGDVFVCNNKDEFEFEKAKVVLGKKLKENFAKETFEYHYSFIRPLIMAEEYLDDGTGKNPLDYKFYVFNGKCDRILVCSERDKQLRLDDFDTNWNHLNDTLPKYRSEKAIRRPINLGKMIKIAEELCKKDGKVVIPFARVDLYDLNGKIYFGEYTFTPAKGLIYYYNQRTLDELGEKLDLSWYN